MSVSEAVPPELDVFSTRPFQLSVEKFEDVGLSPINSVDINSNLEFYCNGFSNVMKDLSEMYLVGTIQLVKEGGGAYVATDLQPRLINNSLLSLFKSCSLYLNRTLVSSQTENYGITEYVNCCLNFSSHAAEAKLSIQGFFPPSQDAKLTTQLNESKPVQFMAKVNMMNTDKFLIPSVSLGLKFDFQKPEFYLIERTKPGETVSTKTKVNLTEVKLFVRHFTIRAPYLLHMETMLARKINACYEYHGFNVVNTTISFGQSSFSNHSLYNGLKPGLLMLAFLTNKNYVGDTAQDPLIFTSHNLSEIAFTINNEEIPRGGYSITATNTNSRYARLFASLYNSLGMTSENTSISVDRESFIERHFFVVQDVSSFSSALTTLKDGLEVVNIGFNARFSSALTSPLTALLFLLLPHKVEIDSARAVKIVY